MSNNQRQHQLLTWLQSQKLFSGSHLTVVSGDASFRRYFRFIENGQSYIAVDAPPAQENCQAFVALSEAYLALQVRVPKVIAVDYDYGFMCIEDFGDRQFSQQIVSDEPAMLYQQALSLLPRFQPLRTTTMGAIADYDMARLTMEASLFSEWLLATHLALPLSAQQRTMLTNVEQQLITNFRQQPQVAVHRDFHSRNLMMVDDKRIGVIDFQDTLIGPITYDIVSLLRDCYVAWPSQWCLQQLLQCWSTHYSQYPWADFKRWFDLTGMQRHLKAAGIFARLYHRDKKPVYMQDIPRTLQYVVDIGAQYPEFVDFSEWLREQVLPKVEASLLKNRVV